MIILLGELEDTMRVHARTKKDVGSTVKKLYFILTSKKERSVSNFINYYVFVFYKDISKFFKLLS